MLAISNPKLMAESHFNIRCIRNTIDPDHVIAIGFAICESRRSERRSANEAKQLALSRRPAAALLWMVPQFAVAISGHMTRTGDYVNLTGFLVAVGIPECGPGNQQLNS
jgi:hypothetical protein